MMEKATLLRAGLALVFKALLFLSCTNTSDKANVEKQNKDKFSSRDDRKEAQFLVDAVDKSYALLEVAQLGEEKIEDPVDKGKAKIIVEQQSRVAMRLKTFAEEYDVSIPLSGPENTKRRVENLYDKNGDEFKESWVRQMSKLNSDLRNDLEKYHENASEPLKIMLDSTTELMSKSQQLITELESKYQ